MEGLESVITDIGDNLIKLNKDPDKPFSLLLGIGLMSDFDEEILDHLGIDRKLFKELKESWERQNEIYPFGMTYVKPTIRLALIRDPKGTDTAYYASSKVHLVRPGVYGQLIVSP